MSKRQAWVAGVIIAALLATTSYLFAAIYGYEVSKVEPLRIERTIKPTSFGPPVSKCPSDVELWECIRHAMYRRDI
jgi:hypothetical protein